VDEPIPSRWPAARFGPDRRLTAACAAGALVALVIGFTVLDAAGRILFVLLAALLVGYAITDVLFAPRLVADADGLRVLTPFARAHIGWADVDRVHADSRQRYGLRSVTLEIDAGEELIVLSRRALGEDPELVAEIVNSFVPSAG